MKIRNICLPATILTFVSVLILSGCGIYTRSNNITPESELVWSAGKKVTAAVATEIRASTYTRIILLLNETLQKCPPGDNQRAAQMFIASVQDQYQDALDDIVDLIAKIQNKVGPDSPLLSKGKIKNIELIITLNDEINASSWDDTVKPIIYLPLKMVLKTLSKLLVDYAAQKKMLEDYPDLHAAAGLTDYVPLIEFEEIIRFTLAHEATHIWLHRVGEPIRKREIEADAWGIILSSQLSDAFKFRAKASNAALTGGFSSNNSLEVSMLCSKTGPDVLFYLYGEEGIFKNPNERESLAERKASIEQTYEKILTDYMASLSAFDSITFKLSRILFSGQ